MKIFSIILHLLHKVVKRICMYLYRPLFKSYGSNFIFDASSIFSFHTISVGNDVFIGPGATILSADEIIIGSKVMLGPNVTIIGGDHNTSIIGSYMYDVKEKQPENDLPINIKDDVWVGTGAIILKGVTIGEGSIVAAGSVVTSDVPEFSVVGGIPAKVLKMRFNDEEIKNHKSLISKYNNH